jgi:flagellar hook protein FlgE
MRTLSLSGLNAAATALDVISNNIANAHTNGFKSSKAQFSDVLATQTSKWSAVSAPNEGVMTPKISAHFHQGVIDSVANPLSMAIDGVGFLRMERPDGRGGVEVTYTRNGDLRLGVASTDGMLPLVQPDGKYATDSVSRKLTGYPVNAATGKIDATNPPVVLGLKTRVDATKTSAANISVNLDSGEVPPTRTFSIADSTSYNYSTSIDVFDAAGVRHELAAYFVKDAALGKWSVYTSMDGAAPSSPDTLQFAANGSLTPSTTTAKTFELTGGGSFADLALDFAGSTQYGLRSTVLSAKQNGFAEGNLVNEKSISIAANGEIWGRYSNGENRLLGQVVLANFINASALLPQGSGQWRVNADPAMGSGPEIIGFPRTPTAIRNPLTGEGVNDPSSGMGAIIASAVETSNVELNDELVQMIIQQRNYQANAQTFKILDDVLKNLQQIR